MYQRVRHNGTTLICTMPEACDLIAGFLRDGDDDYEVTNAPMTREQFEALPESAGF